MTWLQLALLLIRIHQGGEKNEKAVRLWRRIQEKLGGNNVALSKLR